MTILDEMLNIWNCYMISWKYMTFYPMGLNGLILACLLQ